MATRVNLRWRAWHGDEPLALDFPDGWDVTVVSHRSEATPGPEEIASALRAPIGSPRLSELARGRRRVAILVDDLTRPTPGADLLPPILDELRRAGLPDSAVTVLVAGGTHAPASPDDVRRKVGPVVAAAVRVVPHDCRRDVVSIGRSQRGTPLSVNRLLVECDLKIGVGCVHPHPAAGFSGGSKIVMPAACGFETARAMHDYVKGAGRRGGSLDTALRREIEEVAARVGLDFIVNAVLTADRRVEAVFAGDRVLAHRAAVRCFERLGRVQPVPDADVVVADMYPFDCNLQFAYDRGLWPVLAAGTGVSKVVVAACPLGTGSHDLYPVARMWRARLRRRLRRLRPRDLADPLEKLRVLLRMIAGGRQELSFLAPGLSATDLRTVFPRGRRYDQWPGLLADLTARRRREPVRVAVYRCAPLLLPELEPRGGA